MKVKYITDPKYIFEQKEESDLIVINSDLCQSIDLTEWSRETPKFHIVKFAQENTDPFDPERFGWEATIPGRWEIQGESETEVMSYSGDDVYKVYAHAGTATFSITTNQPAEVIFKALGIIE